jgi:hypothetical protein
LGTDQDSPSPPKNQGARRTPRISGKPWRVRRPRRRVCLLKGCGRVFRPRQPIARYCSEACRAAASRWRQWKARRRYRQSANGKQKRQVQSRRYRERRKERQAREGVSVAAARVITTNFFFVLLRPPRLLCGVRPHAAISPATVVFLGLPPRPGAGAGTGAALARTAALSTME